LAHVSHQIDWAFIFYICFGLGVLIILDKVLGLSLARFVNEIVGEFKSLLGRGPIDRGKMNALLIVVMFCFCGFYFLVDPVRQLIDVAKELKGEAGHPEYVAIPAIFMIGVVGLLSVLALGKK
jgi:hypothetical protein